MKRIYLDACIIIYIVEKHPVYSVRIEKNDERFVLVRILLFAFVQT